MLTKTKQAFNKASIGIVIKPMPSKTSVFSNSNGRLRYMVIVGDNIGINPLFYNSKCGKRLGVYSNTRFVRVAAETFNVQALVANIARKDR